MHVLLPEVVSFVWLFEMLHRNSICITYCHNKCFQPMGMVLQNIYNLPNLFENYEFFTCKCYIVTPRPTYVGKYISYQKKKP